MPSLTLVLSGEASGGVTNFDFDTPGTPWNNVAIRVDDLPQGVSFPDEDPDHILRAAWFAAYVFDPSVPGVYFCDEPHFVNFKNASMTWHWPGGGISDGIRWQVGPFGHLSFSVYYYVP